MSQSPRVPSVCDELRRSFPTARPISAFIFHPTFLLQRLSAPPAEGAPRRATRLPRLFSPTCVPRSYTATAAATRLQIRHLALLREVQTAVSRTSRRSSTTRSVIIVTGRGTNPSPRPFPASHVSDEPTCSVLPKRSFRRYPMMAGDTQTTVCRYCAGCLFAHASLDLSLLSTTSF